MGFTALALAIGAVVGLVTGGRLRHVVNYHVRAWWLLVPGFGLQAAMDHIDLSGLGTVLLLAGYGCLFGFAARNGRLVGMAIVAVGLAANALVIALNGGMPVRPSAVVKAHIASHAGEAGINYGYRHHREGPDDKLVFLADIIPIPELHQVLSFGDLILAVGVADVAAHLLHPPKRHAAGEPAGPEPAAA